uniref:Pericentrin/AKAP-450 centrosomal targeting domain-containing protein n=1 Tax=Lepisosteus oculatus TaxID=7918 RepID=W5MX64_LEPOC
MLTHLCVLQLAEYRQRKAQADGQKKTKKKKRPAGAKDGEPSRAEERGEAGAHSADPTVSRSLRSGDTIRQDQTYTIEPESEVSTTADDYTSEVNGCLEVAVNTVESKDFIREEEVHVSASHSEHEAHSSQTRLQIMEDELAAKQQAVEELSRELEEMRAAYGSEGLQQLQEFEAAIKQRDGIITQLTANLQQARKEKDEIMREFLELTDQSQKLQIQFQQLQAGETLRNTSHSSTAADLLQAKQQILMYQQQTEEKDLQLKGCQRKNDEQQMQISQLQERVKETEMLSSKQDESFTQRLREQEKLIAGQQKQITEHEVTVTRLKEELSISEKSLQDLMKQLVEKQQELETFQNELTSSKQREKMSSDEIKQLMGTVEELQKRNHRGNQAESEIVQRMKGDMERKMDQLQAEMDEMYGQQIVQMKQELRKQHLEEINRLTAQHRSELKVLSLQSSENGADVEQINLLNMKIIELQQKLKEAQMQKDKVHQELTQVAEEKLNLQSQVEDLLQDLRFVRGKVQRASQSISDQEHKLSEVGQLHATISDLQTQLTAAAEATKELETKHESEITNYKIKLEMLEREKDAVLDRMAESQEAELDRLRTQLLFSHEEELTKLREDLQRESQVNIESLKDEMSLKHKQVLESMRMSFEEQLHVVKLEKEKLAADREALLSEISQMKDDLNHSLEDPMSKGMALKLEELQTEICELRKEEKEKYSLEREIHELSKKNELLEKETKEREVTLGQKIKKLESEKNYLEETNEAMRQKMKSVDLDFDIKDNSSALSSDIAVLPSRMHQQIESLTLENKKLSKQITELKENLERQTNTFSFAERNFEVNYQELKDEYTCLVKVKAELEERLLKEAGEHETELNHLRSQVQLLQAGKEQLGGTVEVSQVRNTEDFIDGGEVVEKDTTELMEKLEIAQREKKELSLRLSEASEQLNLKQNEIEQLKDELMSVTDINKQILASYEDLRRGQGAQGKTAGQRQEQQTWEIVQTTAVTTDQATGRELCTHANHLHQIEAFEKKTTVLERDHIQEQQSALAHENETLSAELQELRGKPVAETPVAAALRADRDQLQQQLDALRAKQDELRLQMEAQRISLSQICAAQLELLRESLLAEKEACLHSLEESLVGRHAQEVQQLHEKHQQELQHLKEQKADYEAESRSSKHQRFISMVSEECTQLILLYKERFMQKQKSLLVTGDITLKTEERPFMEQMGSNISKLCFFTLILELYTSLHMLKDRILQECNRLTELQSLLTSDCNKLEELQTAYDELRHQSEKEIASLRMQIDSSRASSQDLNGNLYINLKEQLKVRSAHLEEVEKLKTEFHQRQAQLEEQHLQEIERLRVYYQQQARDLEDRYTTELVLLQQRLQEAQCRAYSHYESISSEAQLFEQKEMQSIEELKNSENNEIYIYNFQLDDIELEVALNYPLKNIQELEKRHKERTEEEVAKVIVQMSVEFAQQTELARLNKQARETTTKMQTLAGDPDGEGEAEMDPSSEEPGLALEQKNKDSERRLLEEKAALSKQLQEKTAEILTLTKQLQQTRGAPLMLDKEGQFSDTEGGSPKHPEDTGIILPLESVITQEPVLPESKVATAGLAEDQCQNQKQEHLQAAQALRVAHTQPLDRQQEEQVSRRAELDSWGTQLDQVRLPANHEATVILQTSSVQRAKARREGPETVRQEGYGPALQSRSTQTEQNEEENKQGDEEKKTDPETSAEGPGFSNEFLKTKIKNVLRRANERLRQVLRDVLKTTAAAEETIGRHVEGLLDASGRGQPQKPFKLDCHRDDSLPSFIFEDQLSIVLLIVSTFTEDASSESCYGSEAGRGDGSVWSGETEEGLEMSQRLTDGLFQGADLQLENEECLMSISSRLQGAVEKLLEAITETTNQLEHAKVTQTELMRESFRHNAEISELVRQQEELQERLDEEAKAKEQLALELHRAEGLIDGYTEEKAAMEEQVRQKEELLQHLEQELRVTGSRLLELEQERQQMQQERELLSRQQAAMRDAAGPRELCLLEETEKLMKEKVEVQRQAEKESGDLLQQVKALEVELEEQVNRAVELEQAKAAESADLRQQIQALEKQLEKNRKFLDEQAIDREHERDVFQQEIQKLEQQLKSPQKLQPSSEQRNRKVEQLTSQLKEKADRCSELLLHVEQLDRDVQERNEEIEKLECRIRELEQALIVSTERLQKVEERKQYASVDAPGEMTLEVQLQTEREALDRKEKEICNLEEQLEQFREELENKNEEVQQLHMQMEIQRKELSTQQQELEHGNTLLKNEVELLKKSHCDSEDVSVEDRVRISNLTKVMEDKDREIALLNEQLFKLQQLENVPDNKEIEEKDELLKELRSEIECLRSEQERLKKKSEDEVEQLNEVIEKLQQELSKIEHKTAEEYLPDSEDPLSQQHLLERILERDYPKGQDEKVCDELSLVKAEFEELKMKMEQTNQELDTLKSDHIVLLEKYDCLLKESSDSSTEKKNEREEELEEIRLKMEQAFIQAELKALEQSANSRVADLNAKVEDLEVSVEEKDSELRFCRLQVDQTRAEAQTLQRKILQLEDALREKVAAALVSQAQLGAFLQQSKEHTKELYSQIEELQGHPSEHPGQVGRTEESEKTAENFAVLLTQKIIDLENELTDVQKDQDLQKQLLLGSEEELEEYEKRLVRLMNLLEQISKWGAEKQETLTKKASGSAGEEADRAAVSQLAQELQEVRAEAAATKEELSSSRERADKLQEELQVRDLSVAQLQEDLQRVKEALAGSERELALHTVNKEAGAPEGELDFISDKNNGTITKDKASLPRRSSASQTDKPVVVNGSVQTLPVACRDAEVQADLVKPGAARSEDIAEVISQYTEKIGQMQDLHAAEIMDMETRHISESETLKRDLEMLREECQALNALVDKLRTAEESSYISLSIYFCKNSSSDWSQRLGYDIGSQNQEFRSTPEGARRDNEVRQLAEDMLPDKIKSLLREVHKEGMQVLSLSELPFSDVEPTGAGEPSQSWQRERDALLAAVESLKTLITTMQAHRGPEPLAGNIAAEQSADWRGELLHAVQQVFLKERGVLTSALKTHLEMLDTSDIVVHLNQLECRLDEQDTRHREAMEFLQGADRQSLLTDVRQLQAQLHSTQPGQSRRETDGQSLLASGKGLKKYRISDIKSGHAQNQQAAEGKEALLSERMVLADLKNELAQTRLELETTLAAQHKRLKELEALRTEVSEKAAEVDRLNDALAEEQRKARELQWAFEKEKCKSERTKERENEELEDLKLALADQKHRVGQLAESLEQEREAAESERARQQARLTHEQGRVAELQVQLESEKARAQELSGALERERGLHSRRRQQQSPQRRAEEEEEEEEGEQRVEELLADLQRQLDEKHSRIAQLVGDVERHKLEAAQVGQQWDEERRSQRLAAQREREALQLAQDKLQQLQGKAQELQRQLDRERQQVLRLQQERDRLGDSVRDLQDTARLSEAARDSAQPQHPDARAQNPWKADLQPSDRTRDWVLQQKMSEVLTAGSSSLPLKEGAASQAAPTDSRLLDSVIPKLQLIASKIRSLASKASSSVPFEELDSESLVWLLNSVQDVVSQLQQLPPVPPVPESPPVPSGDPSSSLAERLLRQNAELTGFVSRLTEEKNDLRNALIKLEEELRRYRHRGLAGGDCTNRSPADNQDAIDAILVSDREAWNREKASLEKSLQQAEAEVSRLRSELRTDSLCRDMAGSDSDSTALKRIYGKYLRAESFRKALIYQKKYLLLLLGGFQECEEATLSLIARMGGRPSYTNLEVITHHRRGFTRFRSVVRVSIALSRMKFLVRRWQRATGSGSSPASSVNRNGFGQITGNEVRTDSPYLHPEVYGERRASSRGRSGRESPRSTLSVHHRYQTTAEAPGSLACSHLQNYDPDRALTDYISRLEALQRRLGSVQSGSTSYAPLHYGIRR